MNMHRIERAIILAAGFGQRLNPVTLTTPKPLVCVNGIRMIDTIISALHQNGIFEIYVVAGYRKEQFHEWAKQYPGITILDNPWFESCNNISSLYTAREHLDNALILEGDLVIADPSILFPSFSRSGYSCTWTDVPTNEWFLTTRDGIVTSCSRTGGAGGWQLYGISRWTASDAATLRAHLEELFIAERRTELFWDDIALFCRPGSYSLGVYPMETGSVIEIDSYAELLQLDPSYIPNQRGV